MAICWRCFAASPRDPWRTAQAVCTRRLQEAIQLCRDLSRGGVNFVGRHLRKRCAFLRRQHLLKELHPHGRRTHAPGTLQRRTQEGRLWGDKIDQAATFMGLALGWKVTHKENSLSLREESTWHAWKGQSLCL